MTNNPFKRVVVLMMENHSYDHLLGWVPGVGNLNDTDGQYDSKGNFWPAGKVTDPKNDDFLYDPHHDFTDVITQMYGTTDGSIPVSPAGSVPQPAPGKWFLQNNSSEYPNASTFMECFTPDQIPALATLAQNYTTCGKWFAALPGATGPNRLFTHCATSGGYSGSYYNYNPENPSSFAPPMKSIFNSLQDNGNSWAIYWDQTFSTARALTQLAPYVNTNFHDLSKFESDAASGNLAEYVFFTPSLTGRNASAGLPAMPPNSMHPNENNGSIQGTIADGDELIRTVYNALASNKTIWEETLFLIVFDEHGGFYDSVMPPANLPYSMRPTAEPSWNMPPDNVPFGFMNYGPRVPAIVISAWTNTFLDSNIVFEHSAIPATVKEIFGLPEFLTNRDANSPCFHNAWPLLAEPRAPISL